MKEVVFAPTALPDSSKMSLVLRSKPELGALAPSLVGSLQDPPRFLSRRDKILFAPTALPDFSSKILVVILIAVIIVAQGEVPVILSATHHDKIATVLGGEQRYLIYEMVFDQPLYYQENWPCPCIQNGMGNCSSNSQSINVDETNYNITYMEKDKYYYQETNFTDLVYFKFSLSATDYQNCPLVMIDLQSIYGQMQLMVSTDRIPTLSNHTWYKYQLQRDSLWICPTDSSFRFGTWYITVQNAAPVTLRSAFRIKWSVLTQENICVNKPAPVQEGMVIPNSIRLYDGIAHHTTLELLKYEYYHYFPQTVCTDFSVSARQESKVEGDVDIYVSLTDPLTSFETGYDWSAFINHDDSLSLRSICSPSGNISDFVIYISVQTWKGNNVPTMVVATETYTFISRPVVELPPQGLFNSLTGATFELNCQNEVLYCQFPAHIHCMEPQAPYQCCSPLMIIPPTENANPLWPSLRAFRDLEFSRNLPWELPGESEANENWGNVPNKLTLAILRDVRYPHELRKFVQNENMDNCTLVWKHNFANQNGEAITMPIVFTPKKKSCNYTAFTNKHGELKELIKKMESSLDYREIQMIHLQIQMVMTHDDVISCKDSLETFFQDTYRTLTYENQHQCYSYRFTSEYDSDPCCTYMGTLHHCCGGKDITIQRPSVTESAYQDDLSQCFHAECSQETLAQYLTDLDNINDAEQGCTATWEKIAGSSVITELTKFIPECRNSLLGLYDLRGVPCTNDTDCQYNRTCNTVTKRCNHDDMDVVQCWVDNMTVELQQSLFNHWNITKAVTPSLITDEIMQRMRSSMCTGPNSLQFRNHWFWDTMAEDCTDLCSEQNLAPLCFEPDANYCPIPPECPEASEESCFHWWTFVDGNALASQCETEVGCNWLSKPSNMTNAEYLIACRVGESVCLDCTGDSCDDTGFTQSECLLGLCSLNNSIHDPLVCNSQGKCSIKCGQRDCSTKAECESFGLCTLSNAEDSNIADACFSPFEPDFYGTPYCNWLPPTYPYGCLVPSINTKASCESQSNQWGTFIWISNTSNAVQRDQCQLISTTQCYNAGFDLWVKMNQTECTECGLSYQPTIQWKQGVWIPGNMIPLQWTTRKMEPLRKVQMTLDYLRFYDEISQAIMATIALAFSTEATCRTTPILNAINAITCDCQEKASQCYNYNTIANDLGVGRACPFIPSNISIGNVVVDIPSDALAPTESCKPIYLKRVLAEKYEVLPANRISSDLFVSRFPHPYAVVENEKREIIGQIVTDGIDISWPGDGTMEQPLRLCIARHPTIKIEKEFTSIVFAKLESNKIIYFSSAETSNDTECAFINNMGTYFGARVVSDSSTILLERQRLAVMGSVSAVFYAIISLISIIQLVRIARLHQWKNKVIQVKTVSLVFAIIFSIARIINMLVFTTSWYNEGSGGNIHKSDISGPTSVEIGIMLLVEIPTILFYVMYTSIIFIWFKVVAAVTKFKLGNIKEKSILQGYILTNILVVFCFLILLIVYYTVPENTISPCKAISNKFNNNKHIVNIIYLIFIAILSILATIAYIVAGSMFLREISIKTTRNRTELIIMTILILILFSLLFIIRSIVILWSTVTGEPLPILLYVALEVLPCLTILYYIYPPKKSRIMTAVLRRTTRKSQSVKTSSSLQQRRSNAAQTSTELKTVKSISNSQGGHSDNSFSKTATADSLDKASTQISSSSDVSDEDRFTVKITDLHRDMVDDDLLVLFKSVGDVYEVKVLYDETGRSKGEAMVIFNNKSSAQKAVTEFDGHQIDGQAMRLVASLTLPELSPLGTTLKGFSSKSLIQDDLIIDNENNISDDEESDSDSSESSYTEEDDEDISSITVES